MTSQKKPIKSENSEIELLKAALAVEKEKHRQTKIKLKMREGENHAITQSMSYKLAKLLAKPKHFAQIGYTTARGLNPHRIKLITVNKRYVKRIYSSENFSAAFKGKSNARIAVVIHLYYLDMLPFFIEKLHNLDHISFDLYVTITDENTDYKTEIQTKLPYAKIAVVPNCGRDVLPFVQVMKKIAPMGYTAVLKMHSKKSPHRSDGSQWRDKIIESLVPKDKNLINRIISTLQKDNTAIIGPTGEYVSMLVNLSSTTHHVMKLTRAIMSEQSLKILMRQPDEYGFFAGTMFWARVDAIMPVINAVNIYDFEPEFGQQDSTMAHALERMLNVVPELQNKNMYQVQDGIIKKVNYHSTNIPEWSGYAIDK